VLYYMTADVECNMHDDAYDEAKKERKRANNKAYKEQNRERLKAENKAYKNQNKERKRVSDKAYYEKNKERKRVSHKAYKNQNKERKRVSDKAYQNQNKEYLKAEKKAYYEKNQGYLKAEAKAYYEKNAARIYASKGARNLRNYGCIECREWPVDQQVGLPHYDGYCFRCFCHEFPHDERVKNRGRVELRVRAYLNSHFSGFIHNHQMPTAHCVCDHRRRIDHRREVGNTLLCIETDEHHHRNYDKDDEDARYHDVLVAWGGKLVFIRINPDGKGPPLEERLERLHAEITRHIGRLERGENSAFLEVWHLYYPEGTEDYCGEAIAPEGL
jgi:hypothetical protein